MLVYFVHHLAHSIQIDQVMKGVEKATLRVLEHSFVEGDPTVRLPTPPPGAIALTGTRSGYVQAVHAEAFVAALEARGLSALIVPIVGRHVVAGTALAWVWGTEDSGTPDLDPRSLADLHRVILQTVRIGYERTLEQDVAFGIRQLADIASKALSPAVNDPYTANQAVDHLASILAALTVRQHGPRAVKDGKGRVRLHVPARDFEYLLELALGQVRRYGANEPRVVRALLRVCRDVGGFGDEAHRAVVRRYVTTLLDDVQRMVPQAADREPLLAEGAAVLAALA
ncbi:Putative membrane protein [Sinomonas atrocyanea]|uniref:Putative membrane protein n=2 Tax=Sinomonas atrocyanea TaxID=37927 RepID=A0A127A4Y0_9MICC|nr:Putative membrane protein [Sinomonas atrocyanea]